MTASFIFSVSALYVACGHEIGIHTVKTAYYTREEQLHRAYRDVLNTKGGTHGGVTINAISKRQTIFHTANIIKTNR